MHSVGSPSAFVLIDRFVLQVAYDCFFRWHIDPVYVYFMHYETNESCECCEMNIILEWGTNSVANQNAEGPRIVFRWVVAETNL